MKTLPATIIARCALILVVIFAGLQSVFAGADPRSGSPLTSYAVDPAQHVIFIDSNNHVHELFNAGSEPDWHEHDLTASASAPNPAAGSPLTSYAVGAAQHVIFIDANNHVHELFNAGSEPNWHEHDLTASAAAPNPNTASPLTSYAVGSAQHVIFIDTSNHVHELWNGGSEPNWHGHDLTASAAAPAPATGSNLTSYTVGSAQHVIFIDTNNHLHELWNAGFETNWHEHDLTASASAPNPNAGSPLTSYAADSAQHVIFIDTSNHVHELFNAGTETNWHEHDLTTSAAALPPVAGSALTSYTVHGAQRVIFISAGESDVQELFNAGSEPTWHLCDVTLAAFGLHPPILSPAARSPLTSYAIGNSQHVIFIDTNNHVHELFDAGSMPDCDWQEHDLTASVLPPLTFLPPNITVGPGSTQNAILGIPNPASALVNVNLGPSNANVSVAGRPPGTQAMVDIPQGAATSAPFVIQGVQRGNSTVTASASGFRNGVLNIAIAPTGPSTPLSFAPSNITMVAGNNQSVTVNIPTAASTLTTVSLSPANADVSVAGKPPGTPSTVVIPLGSTASAPFSIQGVQPGNSTVTASATGFQNGVLAVAVLMAPAPPPQVVFRSADSEVESFNFSDPAHPTAIDHQPATPAGWPAPPGCSPVPPPPPAPQPPDCNGPASPSLAFDAAGHLLRTTVGDVQVFTVALDGHMQLFTAAAAQPSFTSLALAAKGSTIFRAIDTGLQSFQLSGNNLGTPHFVAGTVSFANVGLDVSGTVAVRAHPTGIDIFDVTDPTQMRLLGSYGMGSVSSTGVDIKILPGGTRVVRAESSGIELYDVSRPVTPQLIGANNTSGTPSFAQMAVVVDDIGANAIRVTPNGIEVYGLMASGLPRLDNCSPNNGNCNSTASTTGTGAAISVDTVFRGLAGGAEAFDVTNPRSPRRLSEISATPAFTGVGLTSR